MSSLDLSPTARVILGLIKLGARTGYDVKRMTSVSTRFFWGASYGQIYPELRRLEAAGLLASEPDPRGGLQRRAYRLTDAGETVLREWLLDDGELRYEVRDEGLLKLFFADLLAPEEALELARRRARWFEAVTAQFRQIERDAEKGDGEPESFTRVALDYGIELMEWTAGWYRGLEARLRRGARARPRRPAGTRAPRR